ncbi:capsular biosynthesis protein [Roseobacter sp. YSTF-M11]|uniref:Capsular biosynthesis protein n=1 Tax=Roseobacter insulae TaxID=2859783 RepID=A0A9X1FSA2_9RHOB|nr:capsular biosynthesis protein [Roseobacter insulae]MBW4706702.1 capsular biosynthesis protein [Roseobacter insulae]
MTRVASVARRSGFEVAYLRHEDASSASHRRGEFSLTDLPAPVGRNGLIIRACHHAPFWQIDQAAEACDWDVSKADFDPQSVPRNDAMRFYHYWRERLFGDAPLRTSQDGFVFVPLQRQLTARAASARSTQLEMIASCLRAEPERTIVASLHPKETYSDAELTALNHLDTENDRLTVRIGAMKELLRTCDYVVTQNATVGFNGLFFGKPSILFAKTDFHHAALTASADELAAFRKVMKHRPEWARYVWWFWHNHAINAGRKDVDNRIADRLRRFDWPIK